jgi:hypothetical protein
MKANEGNPANVKALGQRRGMKKTQMVIVRNNIKPLMWLYPKNLNFWDNRFDRAQPPIRDWTTQISYNYNNLL